MFRLRGITLVEILIVVVIIGIVAACAYPFAVRSRQSAAITVTGQRMAQIHRAMLLYTADHEGADLLHSNVAVSLSATRNPHTVLKPYYKDGELLFCALTPPCARNRLASTHIYTTYLPVGHPMHDPSKYHVDRMFSDLTKGYPLIHSLVADEVIYYPRERSHHDESRVPFVQRLLPDGSLQFGRYDIMQPHDIARACR